MKQAGALLLSLAIIGGTVFPAGQIRAAAETKQPENSMKAATVSDAEKIPGTTVPGLLSRRPETMGKKRSSGGEVYVSASSSNARWDSGAGTEEDPYISLAYAVDQAEDGDTICLMSDLTETKSARFWDKDLTIDGQGHTVIRGDPRMEREEMKVWYRTPLWRPITERQRSYWLPGPPFGILEECQRSGFPAVTW